MNQLTNEALYSQSDLVIIDVRTSKEYNDNHIYSALSMPIFNEEERHTIGCTYKKSKQEAQKLGLKFLQSKLHDLLAPIIDLAENHDYILIYCARGGMRSGSVVSLLNSMGYKNVYQLKDGMKGHRAFIQNDMNALIEEKNFIVLHGHTGVGKSKILSEIDYPILDLEGYAKNAGSVFGYVLFEDEAPTQKYFEELLYHHIKTSKTDYIVTESESKRIGRVLIPDVLITAFESGHHILIETTIENRIRNILDAYLNKDENTLEDCINKLRKRISNQKADQLIDWLKCGKLKLLVEYLLTDYYDPMYKYSIDKFTYDNKISYSSIEESVEQINSIIERLIHA